MLRYDLRKKREPIARATLTVDFQLAAAARFEHSFRHSEAPDFGCCTPVARMSHRSRECAAAGDIRGRSRMSPPVRAFARPDGDMRATSFVCGDGSLDPASQK